MSESSNNEREQLLMAYLDGQLGAEERSHVESLIESNPDDARLVEQWREQGDLLRSMPKFGLDERFADRVMAAIVIDESGVPESNTRNHDAPAAGLGSDLATSWRTGAAAIAALAALLLLTLFVFPGTIDQPSVAVKADSDPVVGEANDSKPDSKAVASHVDSDGTSSDTDQPSGLKVPEPGVPQRPSLNKTLAGGNSAKEPTELVPPLRIVERPDSLAQVLWVDMKSRQSALADIESVMLKNSMTILPASSGVGQLESNADQGSQNHLEQRPNSRLEALHVFATRGQIRKAMLELSQQYQAKFYAVQLVSPPGLLSATHDPAQTEVTSNGAGPNGKISQLSRLTGSPKSSGHRLSGGAVQQLRAVDLSSSEDGPVKDADELHLLDEWFDLAEKENESNVYRFLLLVDTSSNEPESASDR